MTISISKLLNLIKTSESITITYKLIYYSRKIHYDFFKVTNILDDGRILELEVDFLCP